MVEILRHLRNMPYFSCQTNLPSLPMSSSDAKPARQRPKYYDLNLANLPAPGLLSILHRITGAALFLILIPTLLFILQQTLQSELDFQRWKAHLGHPMAKLILIGFIWAYLHHFLAGIRYLLLDVHVGIDKVSARSSARAVIAAGFIGAFLIGVWLW